MICNRTVNKFCKDDITKIENYDKAIADNTQTWAIHHRLETHFSDGTLRPIDAQITKAELIALDMYFDRPAEELIFMTRGNHTKLHCKGKPASNETRQKMSFSKTGKKRGPMSEDHKKRISESNKGKKRTEESRRKISERTKEQWQNQETRNRLLEARKKLI